MSTKGDAERAVEAAKYGPRGRGACPLVRANGYGLWNWAEYQDYSNENTTVIVLIEDRAGVENIDDILSVEGVDAVYVGSFDMSVAEGYKGDSQHPEILKKLDRVLEAARKNCLPAMHSLLNGRDVKVWAEKGVRLFVQTADAFVFACSCRDFLASVEEFRNRKWD
ncbi:MAG: hypothetical protein A2Z18_00095 [Armatimonadetes bacterium RBG_16_58_9]|nr:MAG: hypothetical protein A2Z18_00095 [Armatimonadetes bacterium RBG_16_58_9]